LSDLRFLSFYVCAVRMRREQSHSNLSNSVSILRRFPERLLSLKNFPAPPAYEFSVEVVRVRRDRQCKLTPSTLILFR
jgi:hypothetical protein